MRPTLRIMGFNKPTWTPGHERTPVSATHFRRLADVRKRREQHTQDKLAARQLEGSLMSLAALLGCDVKDPDGDTVGELRDVVVRWTAGAPYPRMIAIVVRAGKRDVLIGARWIELSPPASVRLRSSNAYARAVERHASDVALAHDVLDHQIVDSNGTQIVRPADVYLAEVDGRVEAVGIEVGIGALLRRLGPRCLRSRIRPQRVIDWRDIASFAPARDDGGQQRGRRSDVAGRAGTGLALGEAAGDVRRLHPSEVRAALRAHKTGSEGGRP
jgi:sporulation protein YlmC with PRC-barrel domain